MSRQPGRTRGGGHHGIADLPGAGVPGRRTRLQRHGHRRIPGTGREIPGPHRGHRLRTLDILEGIRRTVLQLESGRHEVENAYARAVPAEGNPTARAMLSDVFEVTDRACRGIGMIPGSGWRLADAYREWDAEARFDVGGIHTEESSICRSGEGLQGLIKPSECAAFGKQCTPRNPLGGTMVSSEGACAAY